MTERNNPRSWLILLYGFRRSAQTGKNKYKVYVAIEAVNSRSEGKRIMQFLTKESDEDNFYSIFGVRENKLEY